MLPPVVSQRTLQALGLGLGAINTVRHRIEGYRRPRPGAVGSPAEELAYGEEIADRWQADGGVTFAGARVLETGPGSTLCTGIVALARGAASYQAVDLFALLPPDADALHAAMAEQAGVPVAELPSRLRYTLTTFPDLPDVAGPFDLIVSNATLEHVGDVPATLRRLRALAAPGATMVHHVDGRTHMRPFISRDPLNVHRHGRRVYSTLLSFPGAPNRLLASDYLRAAADAGWQPAELVAYRTSSDAAVAAARPALAAPFRDRPAAELRDLVFTFTARA